MTEEKGRLFKIELVFWTLTVLVGMLIILPIISAQISFDLILYNFIYIIVGLTFIRWLVVWEWNPLHDSKSAKILIIFMIPMIFFPLLEGIHSFVEFRDQDGLDSILTHMNYAKSKFYASYITNEYLFFAVGSMICSILMIFKMLRSLWRQYKYADKNKLKEG